MRHGVCLPSPGVGWCGRGRGSFPGVDEDLAAITPELKGCGECSEAGPTKPAALHSLGSIPVLGVLSMVSPSVVGQL